MVSVPDGSRVHLKVRYTGRMHKDTVYVEVIIA
jgi:hypothetical protein